MKARLPELTFRHRFGIRALLIALLLPGVVALLVIDSVNDYHMLSEITEDAYDAALLEPARVLESSIEFDESDTLRIITPLYAQVMLESRAGLRKYFRVEEIPPEQATDPAGVAQAGAVLMGMPDFPRPGRWPDISGEPLFFDAVYRADPVRVVAIRRDFYRSRIKRSVLIMVAESVGKRNEVEAEARKQELLRDGRMLALVVILVWLGVAWALAPLQRLRDDVHARSRDDLTPLDADKVPQEVKPLVDAVNHHIERHRRVLDAQTQFLADASHQMRTPIAVMLTQAQYALRAADPAQAHESLEGIVVQLRRARRLTEQLLALAHANQQETVDRSRIDLNAVAREVVLEFYPLAHEKRQDLGWIDACQTDESSVPEGLAADGVPVFASDVEVREALSNLIHNAINYAPVNACITVSARRNGIRGEVSVCDNGPGLSEHFYGRAFARFDRIGLEKGAGRAEGSGLGLAIARAYMRRNGGDVELSAGDPNNAGSTGLRASIWLPLAPAQAAATRRLTIPNDFS